MENYNNKTYPYCKNQVTENVSLKSCPACGTPLTDEQAFCPNCGIPNNKKPQSCFCSQCGTIIHNGQTYCPKCGQKTPFSLDYDTSIPIGQQNPNGAYLQKKQKKKTPLIIGLSSAGAAILVAVIVIIVIFVTGNQNNFNNMYGDIANEEWCIISSDGKWMKLDTNPYDEDGDYVNRTFYEDIIEPCAEKIQRVNRDLGFKSSIYSEMCETTSDDGYQTESNDKYTVSWSFHPDKGLEVIYEINS